MKLEWRRRVVRRPWLLLRPSPEGGWDWLLLDSAGETRREGEGRPPVDLSARVALIVPGEACSHFQVAAPPGLKRHEWLLLLEDRLLQGAEQTHCACIARPPGQLRLVTVQRASLHAWLAQCEAWGLQVERCWSEFQLLPEPESGAGWRWQQGRIDLWVKADEDGRRHWLAWPEALGAVPAAFTDVPLSLIESRWPLLMADLERLPSLQQLRRSAPRLTLPRQHVRLASLCMLLAGVLAMLWLTQQWRQAGVYREQVLAVTGPQATPRQAAQALKRLREADTEREVRLRQLEDLQARLQGWLTANPHWRLQAVRFDGRLWQLHLQGDGTPPPWAEMAGAVGAQVEVQAAGVVFDLGDAS